jgi:hypothetical protein
MRYSSVSKKKEEPTMTDASRRHARSWVERQLRFERLVEELRTPVPPATQNGACPPASD